MKKSYLVFLFFVILNPIYAQNDEKILQLIEDAKGYSAARDIDNLMETYRKIVKIDTETPSLIIVKMNSCVDGVLYSELAAFEKYALLFEGHDLEDRFLFYMSLYFTSIGQSDGENLYYQKLINYKRNTTGEIQFQKSDYFDRISILNYIGEYAKVVQLIKDYLAMFPEDKYNPSINSLLFNSIYMQNNHELAKQTYFEFLANNNTEFRTIFTSNLVIDNLLLENDCKLASEILSKISSDKYKNFISKETIATQKFKIINCELRNEVDENQSFHDLKNIEYQLLNDELKYDYFFKTIGLSLKYKNFDSYNKLIVEAKKHFPNEFAFDYYIGWYNELTLNDYSKAETHYLHSLTQEINENTHTAVVSYFKVVLNDLFRYNTKEELISKIVSLDNIKPLFLKLIAVRSFLQYNDNTLIELYLEKSSTPKEKSQMHYTHSFIKLGSNDLYGSMDSIKKAKQIYPSLYYDTIELFYQFIYDYMSEASTSEIANQIKENTFKLTANHYKSQSSFLARAGMDEPPKEIVESLKVFSLFHTGEVDKACEVLTNLQKKHPYLPQISSDTFCKKEYSFNEQLFFILTNLYYTISFDYIFIPK